ncbi:MAG: YbfB/YjiJ family MFS transporter [Betaproteobacteria bacterium]|nr:YbfB/YjiJ family MFS transporter [Betaproteobacteria bacterium]
MNDSSPPPLRIALSGLATLALIIGIGRFAFTPVLPMMQSDWGLTLAQGGWLATANYIGYLVGGLAAMRSPLRPRIAIRIGLLTIMICTVAMAFSQGFAAWLVLRAVPGFASAWVMVYASAWVLEKLAEADRADLGGAVYAGVGIGIVVAGLTCLAILALGRNSDTAWIALGVAAFIIVAFVWQVLGDDMMSAGPEARTKGTARRVPEFWRLVLCYGALGLGYIIPATFLPVMAKQIVSGPIWFGWVWPVFGAAAALSTLVAAHLGRCVSKPTIWIRSNLIMAAGVLVPIAFPNVIGMAISALCVGGTFMVITMVGLQEARSIAGPQARTLMGAMTAAFGIGQIVGPGLVSSFLHLPNGFSYGLVASAVPLVIASYSLSSHRGNRLDAAAAVTK